MTAFHGIRPDELIVNSFAGGGGVSVGIEQALGRPVDIAAPYAFFYEFVPGFDGVRVPARFGMVAICMLSVVAGFGAAALTASRLGRAVLAVLSVAFFIEAVTLPFPVNAISAVPGYNTPEARLYRPARAPLVYREIARLPGDAVIAELPLGVPDFDLRSMYYSLAHGRALVNGYSGFHPPHYGLLAVAVSDVARQTDVALEALRASDTTHVVVHEAAYPGDGGPAVTAALVARGAVDIYRDGSDVLLALP